MKALILTEGSFSNGFGHIERCKGLYDELIERGIDVLLVIDGDENVANVLDGYRYKLLNWKNGDFSSFDKCIAIVDSYHLTKDLIKSITKHFYKTLFIDDLNKVNYENSIVVNPSIYGTNLHYPSIDSVSYLIGEKYVMLRKPFRVDVDRKLKDEIVTVTVTMGGTDVLNITPRILTELIKIDNISINIIAGSGYKNIDKIQEIKSNKSDNSNINILSNLSANEMKEVFLNSDLVISACGQTIFELIQLNTISIFINVIDNQVYNEKYIYENKLGIVLDKDSISVSLIESFSSLDLEKRTEILNNLKQISFKDGTKNIVDALLDEYLEKATIEDSKLLFDWRNEKVVRENSFTNEIVTYENHINWFEKKLNDNNSHIYIYNIGNSKVGLIRIDINSNVGVISYSVDKDFRGQGIGKAMIKELERVVVNNNLCKTLLGEVKSSNISSIKIFESLGYLKSDGDDCLVFTKEVLNDK